MCISELFCVQSSWLVILFFRQRYQWRIQGFLERAPTPKVGMLTYFNVYLKRLDFTWKNMCLS